MNKHIYIVTKKKVSTNYISSSSFDVSLSSLNIMSNSHWWDSFLITCIKESDKVATVNHIKDTERLDVMLVAESVYDYQNYTKQYWINKNK